jgi:two-component system C4-dicarboxylate transport sensor histidine kinase DctB
MLFLAPKPTTNQDQAPKRWFLSLTVIIVLMAMGFAALFFASISVFKSVELERAEGRAQLYRSTLISALERLEHLPFIVAQDPAVVRALTENDLSGLNQRLEDFARRANAEAIYVMDSNGWTIAASNYRNEVNFLGKNYGFRPYFKDAMAGKRGEFFAIGATTFKPGFFLGDPVRDAQGRAIGVVALKVALSELTGAWAASGDDILVTNKDGIVVFATNDDWRYRTIAPLSESQRTEIASMQQFGRQELLPLDWSPSADAEITLDGTSYLYANNLVPRRNWTLWYIKPMASIYERTWFVIILGAIVIAAMGIVFVSFRSRQLERALKASHLDRQNLLVEIEERKATERRLERAQSELARTTKLAALGQLAASVTHELGQPISAMRNYLVAEQISKNYTPGGLADKLSAIVARMENITRELKHFSAPAEVKKEPIKIDEVIAGALTLTDHNLKAHQIEVISKIEDVPPILANHQRLEQVIVNLLRNAITAMEHRDERHLTIRSFVENDHLAISIRDSGHGLNGQSIDELQEPFHTNKASGEGMGLGLAISADIVREHDGQLNAIDHGDGAEFIILLPMQG